MFPTYAAQAETNRVLGLLEDMAQLSDGAARAAFTGFRDGKVSRAPAAVRVGAMHAQTALSAGWQCHHR